jgi:hypothetical protein
MSQLQNDVSITTEQNVCVTTTLKPFGAEKRVTEIQQALKN